MSSLKNTGACYLCFRVNAAATHGDHTVKAASQVIVAGPTVGKVNLYTSFYFVSLSDLAQKLTTTVNSVAIQPIHRQDIQAIMEVARAEGVDMKAKVMDHPMAIMAMDHKTTGITLDPLEPMVSKNNPIGHPVNREAHLIPEDLKSQHGIMEIKAKARAKDQAKVKVKDQAKVRGKDQTHELTTDEDSETLKGVEALAPLDKMVVLTCPIVQDRMVTLPFLVAVHPALLLGRVLIHDRILGNRFVSYLAIELIRDMHIET